MKSKRFALSGFFLALAILATSAPACNPVFSTESHVAIVPRVLYSGQTAELSVALLKGDSFTSGDVKVELLKEDEVVASSKSRIGGKGLIQLQVPQLPSGDYQLQVKGPGFTEKASIKLESSFLLFLETDKPIYKPGQTIRISLISLNSELRPVSQEVTVEAQDAKGIKVFKKEVSTDKYGMAELDLPLSEEPNLGTWKLTAAAEDSRAQLDIKVERYVLPKYEVKVTLPKDWFLASDRIAGKVEGIYSFGKPVQGELEIIAKRYVGTWQEYARVVLSIDGETTFELPAVGYVAGVPASGGLGNVDIEFVLREQSTGYEEKTTRLLTIAETPLVLRIVPEGNVFQPGLPFKILLLSEDPGGKPLPAMVNVTASYLGADYQQISQESVKAVDTGNGLTTIMLSPPNKAIAMIIEARSGGSNASQTLLAGYSPSGNFIHLEMTSAASLKVGDTAKFRVHATKEASNFYYEVISGGRVVFSDFSRSRDIAFQVTPQMAGSCRLLVYQVLPNSEIAADYLPFGIEAAYPNQLAVQFSSDEAKPGDSVEINIQSQGQSRVGVVVVDKSVFILAENRMNLDQVFAELERLYMTPQAELHNVTIYPSILTKGAADIIKEAGVIILSDNKVPEGKEYSSPWNDLLAERGGVVFGGAEKAGAVPPGLAPLPSQGNQAIDTSALAQVERIRQYFPETWVWQQVVTDADGKSKIKLTVPDSITTWMLRAVAVSEERGLGIAEAELKAFQPFFIKLDLPYSAVRGEEFPVKVAVYNYLDMPQDIVVELTPAGWFDLLDNSQKIVSVGPGDVGSASFTIRPKGLGFNDLKVTSRSTAAADAVAQPLLIEPEGVPREFVENLILKDGATRTISTQIPEGAVEGSGKVFLSVTGSYLTQTISGLEQLIQMPFGCGEQNMIVFAPDVFITKYLRDSGQLKAEVMAKAEKLMITGYQRELTYRRADGSFSAFGNQDKEGSLWLTSFVLKSFAQARDIIFIDQKVLDDAAAWIIKTQNADGSFEAVGFVHHQEMLGGLSGKDALTAYVASALLEAGEKTASARAIKYLESRLSGMDDPYTLALTAYTLALGGSPQKNAAHDKLMAMAIEDENGLHWGSIGFAEPLPQQPAGGVGKPGVGVPFMPPRENRTAVVETTAYAMLALTSQGDVLNAGRAGKWLTSQRNSLGGYGSTQDTVVALQALTAYAGNIRADVDLTVRVNGPGIDRTLRVTPENFDVLQVIELPLGAEVQITASGKGEVMAQAVTRFNIPRPEETEPILTVDVDYDSTNVAVNDLVQVTATVSFNPPEFIASGMVVLDISVPTGFTPVVESIDAAIKSIPIIKRYDISGRKVIFYLDEIKAGETITIKFQVKATYPVKAKGAVSQVYAYYQPDLKGETLGEDMVIH
ncbi:alpha-2-macroglobulin family protein [Dehalogenimonas sp. 4OHTPN]|uniref:Alpha-2-macroglobulin family protein n=1 Tax=Dehalogenimonas sp. 4OHTPN TaxID=3166643 RepID=A0AAU8GC15_9CHLR